MKTLLILLLVQHGVISAKAGFITYADGRVNVEGRKHLGEGGGLATGASGRAEFMLNPETYMRMLGGTSLILESESLEHVAVRLVEGAAVVDSEEIDRDMPIRVRAGDLDLWILKPGLYLFEEDQVYVLDGELRVDDTETKIKRGWMLVRQAGSDEDAGFDLAEFDPPPSHPLLGWNGRRAAAIEGARGRRPRGFGAPFPN